MRMRGEGQARCHKARRRVRQPGDPVEGNESLPRPRSPSGEPREAMVTNPGHGQAQGRSSSGDPSCDRLGESLTQLFALKSY